MGHPVTRLVAWWASALALTAAALFVGVSACGSAGPTAGRARPSAHPTTAPSAPAVHTHVPGRTYLGRNEYVEFRAGDLPVVVSAPHGGSLEPAEIPNRTSGTTATDLDTEDLARRLASALHARTAREPSLVVCRLKRTRIDVNRGLAEGAHGHPLAEQAWAEYHGFLDAACALAAGLHGRALLVDLHGHSHRIARVEAGYLIGAGDLNGADAELDDPAIARRSSIRTLAAGRGLRFSALLRGRGSLGGLLERAGYPSVPSPMVPSPGTDPYFEGGYIARRHGSADGGPVSAVQIETPYAGVRDTPAARERFAAALADALVTYASLPLRPGL